MNSKDARKKGHQDARKKMLDELNELMSASCKEIKKLHPSQPGYLREVRKQNILLALMNKADEFISDRK